jgi:hypothetical protein
MNFNANRMDICAAKMLCPRSNDQKIVDVFEVEMVVVVDTCGHFGHLQKASLLGHSLRQIKLTN